MNVLHKLTIQSLKQNRTRTLVTIIGIILSTAMLCAVTTFTTSFQQYLLDGSVYSSGSWHVGQKDTTYRHYQELSQSDGVAEAVYLQHLGYAEANTSLSQSTPYFYVLGLSSQGADLLPIHLSQGRMPTASNEIVLFQSFLDESSQYYQPGDTLTLGLGQRISDGFALGEQNPYNYEDGETLEVRESRTYTVVGICNWWGLYTHSSPGYPAFTVADSNLAQDATCDVYLSLADISQAYDFQQAHQLDEDNSKVLMYSGVSRYDTFYTVLYRLAAIVMVIIIAASVILIYNAFAISVSERTRQFGLLSSLGATKKQLRRMVRFEALALSAIGVPLGVLSGIVGIGITLKLISSLFLNDYLLVPMRLHVSWPGVLIAVVLGVVTVLLSAWIPSRRATKVSAMEAIRQSQDIHSTKKLVRPSLLTRKLFGLPGVLGVKYYKRSAKKYRTTVFSLFLSVVLFVSASSFSTSLAKSVSGAFGEDTYDLSVPFYPNDTDISPLTVLGQLRDLDSVDDSAFVVSFSTTGAFSWEDLSQEMQTLSTPAGGMSYRPLVVDFVDDDTYRALCEERNLDPDATSGIAFDGITAFDYQQGKYVHLAQLESSAPTITLLTFDPVADRYPDLPTEGPDGTVQVPYVDINTGETTFYSLEQVAHSTSLDVSQVEQDWPYFLPKGESVKVLYPMSQLESFPLDLSEIESSSFYYMLASDHQQAEQDIKALFSSYGLRSSNLYNYAEYKESDRNLITIINVFSYGFIALISLVAMTNVFNTISTNVILRARDFAMLQSVGMTRREMRRMLGFECILYGTRALILGIPVSIFISYLIYDSIAQGYPLPFQVPWIPLGIACLSVFLVVFATMAYAARKVGKHQLVETLKNENL